MNKGTIIRTVLVIATCLNTALMATDVTQFHNEKVNLIYRIASVVLNFVVVACATYYNNDYTKEACIGTGITRQLKAEQQDGYIGEYFFTDAPADEEGDEDE
jgi:SPP1 family holin